MELDRITAYISFQPKSRIDENIRKQRILGYKEGITTSHWVHKFEKKILPFHVRKRYLEGNFIDIIPELDKDGEIPKNVFNLI